MKPRPPRRRSPASPRDLLPPDIPEASTTAAPKQDEATDPLPEHIRRMLEAAYT